MSEVYFRDVLDNGIPIDVEGYYEPNEEVMVNACIAGSTLPIVLTPDEEYRLIGEVIRLGRDHGKV
jgi:hypothetical protein